MISRVLSFAVVLALACSWDAPRDNPLDPSTGGNLDGRVLTRRATGIRDAEVLVFGAGTRGSGLGVRVCWTDSTGSFGFRGLPVESVQVRLSATGYVPESVWVGLAKGRIDTLTRYLNGLPCFTGCSLSSHVYGRRWPPEPLYFFRLAATVEDPDGAADIDSVWVEIPAIDYASRLTWDPEEEHFGLSLWSSSLPGQSPETLVGQSVDFRVTDIEGAVVRGPDCRLARIVYDLPVPVFPSGGLDTVHMDTTFTWRQFDHGFGVSYCMEIVRIEGGGPAGVVATFDRPGAADTTVRVDVDLLPAGDYIWTVKAIDRLGNSSRSAEELFHAR